MQTKKKYKVIKSLLSFFAIVMILRHVFFCVCHAQEHSNHYLYEYPEREYKISLEVT